jgi:hypothetical protein
VEPVFLALAGGIRERRVNLPKIIQNSLSNFTLDGHLSRR